MERVLGDIKKEKSGNFVCKDGDLFYAYAKGNDTFSIIVSKVFGEKAWICNRIYMRREKGEDKFTIVYIDENGKSKEEDLCLNKQEQGEMKKFLTPIVFEIEEIEKVH